MTPCLLRVAPSRAVAAPTVAEATVAVEGRHPAGPNLGDWFSDALARARGEPLLFKGDDFARTDVKAAI